MQEAWQGEDPKKWIGVELSRERVVCLLLSNWGDLNSIPPEIGLLTKLEDLHLQGNDLKSVPAEIGKLASLEFLNLQGNSGLRSFPAEMGQLKSLKRLILPGFAAAGNSPAWFEQLKANGCNITVSS